MIPSHIILILSLLLPLNFGYLNTGYRVQDLNSTNESNFSAEASQWYASALVTPGVKYYACGNQYMLGGYDILASTDVYFCGFHGCYGTRNEYFQRQYTNLSSHNMIYFSYTVNELDTWDDDDTYEVIFDSIAMINQMKTYWGNWNVQERICGNSAFPDQLGTRVFGRVPHSGSTLTLTFQMLNDEDSINESAGFRDVQLLFATTNSSALTSYMCGVTSVSSYLDGACLCPEGSYANSSGLCQSCNSLCSSCFGASSQECYQCSSSAEWTGKECVSSAPAQDQILAHTLTQQSSAFIMPVRSLQYARYLDIDFPPRLQHLMNRPPGNLLPINSEALMPSSLRSHIPYQPTLVVFTKYNMHPNFLVNFWGETITLLVFASVGLLLTLLTRMQRSRVLISSESVIQRIISLVKWNFTLLLLAFNIDYIILFISIQLRAASPATNFTGVGLAFGICFLLTAAIFLGAMYYAMTRTSPSHSKSSKAFSESNTPQESTHLFFGGYNLATRATKCFYLLYTLRMALPSLIASTLYAFPGLQTALYFAITSMTLLFVSFKHPLTRRLDHIQLIIRETIILITNILLIFMVMCNKNTAKYAKSLEGLGDAVIVANSLLHAVMIIFLVLKVGIEAKMIWTLRRQGAKISSSRWMAIVCAYIQQGAFGFEEMLQDEDAITVVPAKSISPSKFVEARPDSLPQDNDLVVDELQPKITLYPESMQSFERGSLRDKNEQDVTSQKSVTDSHEHLDDNTELKPKTSLYRTILSSFAKQNDKPKATLHTVTDPQRNNGHVIIGVNSTVVNIQGNPTDKQPSPLSKPTVNVDNAVKKDIVAKH